MRDRNAAFVAAGDKYVGLAFARAGQISRKFETIHGVEIDRSMDENLKKNLIRIERNSSPPSSLSLGLLIEIGDKKRRLSSGGEGEEAAIDN